jgi:hypothetical protein
MILVKKNSAFKQANHYADERMLLLQLFVFVFMVFCDH